MTRPLHALRRRIQAYAWNGFGRAVSAWCTAVIAVMAVTSVAALGAVVPEQAQRAAHAAEARTVAYLSIEAFALHPKWKPL